MNKTPCRIMVVEDEQVILDLLRRVLTPPTFHLVTANTVQQGLQLLEQGSFELLMTDLRLPDGSGVEVIRAFRGQFASVPIVIITGSLTPEERLSQVTECGIFSCIEKPFDVLVLRQAVEQAIGGVHA
ncbi:MAG: response regulator [Elusimicrobiota bacterium]|jgi:two-component system response regulator PilR (NtrC family)